MPRSRSTASRKYSLAPELERLDQLQQVFGTRALEGDVEGGALVTKIIERRCTMRGLYIPPATTLRIIEDQAPRQTSTDKIEAAINRIRREARQRLSAPDPEDPPVQDPEPSKPH